jgi:hypothetical protein
LTPCRDQDFLNSIAPEVAQGVNGRVVQAEGEDDDETEKGKEEEEKKEVSPKAKA